MIRIHNRIVPRPIEDTGIIKTNEILKQPVFVKINVIDDNGTVLKLSKEKRRNGLNNLNYEWKCRRRSTTNEISLNTIALKFSD